MSGAHNNAKPAVVEVRQILRDGPQWDRYLVRFRVDCSAIIDSVRERGVIEPVTLQSTDGGYMVISGFSRIDAGRQAGIETLTAVVYEKDALDAKQAYFLALSANAAVTLSDADRATALAAGRDRFGLDEEDLVSAAVLMGLAPSLKIVREYLAIAGLPNVVLEALFTGSISRQHASAILTVPEDKREWFFTEVVERLRLSAGETRVFAATALDISIREKAAFDEALEEALAAGGEAGAPAKQKAAARAALERRLRPVLVEMEEEFAALVAKAGFPAGTKVSHAPGFESDEVEISMKTTDEAAFTALAEAIDKAVASGIVADMTSLARRKGNDMMRSG